MAGRFDLRIEKGATFYRTFLLKVADGQPFNLAGWTGRMQIRRRVRDEAIAATPNVAVSDEGLIQVSLSATQTAQLAITSGVYDLEVVSPTGIVVRVVEGLVTVIPEVTR